MIWVDPDYQVFFPPTSMFDLIENINGEIYRVGKGRITLRFEYGNQVFFLKRHTGIGWQEIFKELFQGRLPIVSAMNEWRALKQLQIMNIPSLQPVACGEQGWNPARRQSFLITLELDSTISLEDLALNWQKHDNFMVMKRKIIRQVAVLISRIHDVGLNHRDMYICHLHIKRSWISDPEGDPEIFIIDLHRAQIRLKVPVRWLVKDIASLYFSSMDAGLTHRDYLRFIQKYCHKSLRNSLNMKKRFWSDVQNRAEYLYATRPDPDKLENMEDTNI